MRALFSISSRVRMAETHSFRTAGSIRTGFPVRRQRTGTLPACGLRYAIFSCQRSIRRAPSASGPGSGNRHSKIVFEARICYPAQVWTTKSGSQHRYGLSVVVSAENKFYRVGIKKREATFCSGSRTLGRYERVPFLEKDFISTGLGKNPF